MQGNGAEKFPEGFLWGAATAAFQIEGHARADGRGESIWDVFARNGGTHNGDTADIAADHYVRFAEDHELARDLGLGALRFSIAWPRVMPDGSAKVNQRGLDHYDRVIDSVLGKGLTPMVTLYHWDLPQALQDEGGWLNRDTAQRFADFADIVVGRYGDRIPFWITLNEPWSVAFLGHAQGLHAPGHRDYASAGIASHHLALAHGLAVPAIRARAPKSEVGVTLCLQVADPWSSAPADLEAARLVDAEANLVFLEPLLKGTYPEAMRRVLPALFDGSLVKEGDLKLISTPIDFLGLNYYVSELIRFDRTVPLLGARRIAPPGPLNIIGNTLAPEGVENILLRPLRDYGSRLPIYVTEIGNIFNDYVTPEGKVHDPGRIEYYDTAFRAVASAIEKGADIRGIFAWTLIDDFEWDAGYSARYGLVYVDYATQLRIPKSSAYWYREVARRNGLPPRSNNGRA